MNRAFFWLSLAFWLTMTALLVRSDIMPAYFDQKGSGYGSIVKGLEGPESWDMVVYKDAEEVGTSHTRIEPNPDGTFVISNSTNIEVRLGMLVSKVQAMLEVYVGKDRELERLQLAINALGARADVNGKRVGDKLRISASLNGQLFEEEMPYENGLVSSYFEPFAVGRKLKVGQVWSTKILDPLSRSFTNAQVRVVGRETLTLALKEGQPAGSFNTYKIVMDWGTSRLQAWATEEGRVLKEETPLGYTLIYRETSEDDPSRSSDEILRRQMRRAQPEPGY